MARVAPAVVAGVLGLVVLLLDVRLGVMALALALASVMHGAWGRLALLASLAASLGALQLGLQAWWVLLGLGGAVLVAWRNGSLRMAWGPWLVLAGSAGSAASLPWWVPALSGYADADVTLRVVILLAGLGAFVAWAGVTSFQDRGT